MDIHKMSGYEFEQLIVCLLKKMGFLVEQTSLSGDGGIDIIAYNREPIYKGKYLIQCKNWENPVGQREVRDLYGVVMSEQANKGILITTSYFTEQAVQFAENKNIELIDYDVLINLLNKYGISVLTDKSSKTGNYFTEIDGFEKDKYIYFKSKIEEERNNKFYYDKLKELFHQYVISLNYEINMHGLIDEYIELNNEIIKRFFRRGKSKIEEAKKYKFINAYLYLLKGEIFKAVEQYKEMRLFYPNSNLNLLPVKYFVNPLGVLDRQEEGVEIIGKDSYGNILCKREYTTSNLVMLKNIYLLFTKFNYQTGIDYIDTLLTNKVKQLTQWLKYHSHPFDEVYNMAEELMMEETRETLSQIKNNSYNKFHPPIYDKKSDNIIFREEVFMPVEGLIETYYSNISDKIENELEKLKILLDVNEIKV